MNSHPLILKQPPRIIFRGVDVKGEYITAIKNADFSRQQTAPEQAALADALHYFVADSRPSVARLAADMLRGGTNEELSKIQELLFAQLTGSLTLLTPFQATVCLFDHDPGIDVSLLANGIERGVPTTRGVSMLRGLCNYCSSIMTGTCTIDYVNICYPGVAKTGNSFLPSIDGKFTSLNATEHGQRLLEFFQSILSKPMGAALPMALIFIFQVVTYFDYMNGESVDETLATFSSDQGPRDLMAARVIRNTATTLASARLDKSIDPEFLIGEFVSSGSITTTIYRANIDSQGHVLVDIDDDKLFLKGKTHFTNTTKLLKPCLKK